MSLQVTPPPLTHRRGSYGIDAPLAPLMLSVAIIFVSVMAIVSGNWRSFIAAGCMALMLVCYLHTTLRGKFLVWADLLKQLELRGDETVLDLGCGRGAVLLMCAQHLSAGDATRGRAIGIDLWRSVDQSGNSMEATLRNAQAEGVADRVELQTADMTALPFADGSIDVIVSSLAIHNLRGSQRRAKAIDEAVRVLRPGGRLLIADIQATRRHEQQLVRLGMIDVTRRRLGWRFWWGGPWGATRLVTASKPREK